MGIERYNYALENLNFLMKSFREVLLEIGEDELASLLPWINKKPDYRSHEFTDRLAQAHSISFELLNMAEENASNHFRRLSESDKGLRMSPGLWAGNLSLLKDAGIKANQILEMLPEIIVEPVFTAHPTEAKRASVLRHHRELYLLIFENQNTIWTPHEKKNIRERIKAVIERLWRTGEIYRERPDVGMELQNIIHYLTEIIPGAISRLDLRFRDAWSDTGFDTAVLDDFERYPQVRFGNWVGGDRDGHPYVDHMVTKFSLDELRKGALGVIRESLEKAADKFTMSEFLQKIPPMLKNRVKELKKKHGETGENICSASKFEPFRQFIKLMIESLPEIDIKGIKKKKEQAFFYKDHTDLLEDLDILNRSVIEINASRLSRRDVFELARMVQSLGFHLASLDIRQNSWAHDLALSELMGLIIPGGNDYHKWSFEKRLSLIETELQWERPFAPKNAYLKSNAESVLKCLNVVAGHISEYGPWGIGSYIVSMTRDVTDLLAVYLFARECGLWKHTDEGPVCLIPVVPLFETIDDLVNSGDIVNKFLDNRITRNSLRHFQKLYKLKKPVMQVMLGYSDSGKDGGIISSQWNLNRSLLAVSETARKKGVKIRFFHGRGGTISRGAGPTHRFLEALPPGTVSGDIRVTEQGETISQKYANINNATYNLELLGAGVTMVTFLRKEYKRTRYESIMDKLALFSKEQYQNLVEEVEFMSFFRMATPIDAIEKTRIGSRPSKRTGKNTLTDLRAIPWVFSWNQSRFFVTGWYGAGSALEKLKQENLSQYNELKRSVTSWPVASYILKNVETSLATADPIIMKDYSMLVKNNRIREKYFGIIMNEYSLTLEMLNDFFGSTLKKRRPGLTSSLELRSEPLSILHREQIKWLKKWRSLKDADPEIFEDYLNRIFFTINAIASGIRTTG